MKGLVYCAPVRVVGSSSWHFNHYALLLQENIFLTHVHHPSIFVSSCQIVFDILEDILLCPFPIFDTLLFILIRYSNIFSKHTCALPLPPPSISYHQWSKSKSSISCKENWQTTRECCKTFHCCCSPYLTTSIILFSNYFLFRCQKNCIN